MQKEWIDRLIEKIKELTADNNHTEARIEIAKLMIYEDNTYLERFELIKKIHAIEGYLDPLLQEYRDNLTEHMLLFFESRRGKEITDKIRKAL